MVDRLETRNTNGDKSGFIKILPDGHIFRDIEPILQVLSEEETTRLLPYYLSGPSTRKRRQPMGYQGIVNVDGRSKIFRLDQLGMSEDNGKS
ncbi:MAG: hypothetical protein Q8P92_05235 [Candidatus Daviesbacteria bacterium]|nr:hypothetical protein [Candidatus Daviesbacteria bacterium]